MVYETKVDWEYEQKCTTSYEKECHGYGYHQECQDVSIFTQFFFSKYFILITSRWKILNEIWNHVFLDKLWFTNLISTTYTLNNILKFLLPRCQKSTASKCLRRLRSKCQGQSARKCRTNGAKISPSISPERSAKNSPKLFVHRYSKGVSKFSQKMIQSPIDF